ncbi:hypothetical protein Bbelb_375310 [Branchiostoma belcheri]|nr:hypothetical protein Bbelb_375310 [Branchiostoma belcheri]
MPVRPQAEWNLIMLLTNFGRNWYQTTKPYLWEYRDVGPGLVITGYLWTKITAAGYRARRQKRLEGDITKDESKDQGIFPMSPNSVPNIQVQVVGIKSDLIPATTQAISHTSEDCCCQQADPVDDG